LRYTPIYVLTIMGAAAAHSYFYGIRDVQCMSASVTCEEQKMRLPDEPVHNLPTNPIRPQVQIKASATSTSSSLNLGPPHWIVPTST
jgi:hypothetical protein